MTLVQKRRLKRRFSGHWKRLVPKAEERKRKEEEARWLDAQIPKTWGEKAYDKVRASVLETLASPSFQFVAREARKEFVPGLPKFLCMLVAQLAAGAGERRFGEMRSERVKAQLQKRCFEAIMRQDDRYLDGSKVGVLLTTLQETGASLVCDAAFEVTRHAATLVCGGYAMFRADWTLAWWVMGTVPFFFAAHGVRTLLAKEFSKKLQEQRANTFARATESVRTTRRRSAPRLRRPRRDAPPEILDAGIFGDAARRAALDAFAAVQRRGEPRPCVRSAPLVVFEDVAFRYDLSRPDAPFAVEGVTLRLEAGKSTALVGASGSGKSSLAKLLLRLHDPERGRVLVDGVPLDALDVLKHRRRVGIVQQEPSLFDRTIYENIAYGMEPPPSRAKVAAAAFAAGVDAVIAALKDGYDTPAGEKSTRLSGGEKRGERRARREKQRVALARALVREPTLMLLDEATSALDAESEASVLEALDAAASGRTTLAIAHRLATIQRSNAIAVVAHGKIVELGTHDELLDIEHGAYAALVEKQSLGALHHIPRTPSARSLDAASVTDSSKGEDEHDHDDDDELLAYHHALSHHQHDRHRHYDRSISV
ncbi:ATPase [Aureococcus anophagefferens]|nr:ATPase [Aureococcus anophagefferens]